ncbi:MAG: hypothetical protein J6A36_05060 [Clostridia bacterium]|nr:hypothetical protein [Clostridia bacterium]
MKKKYLYIIIIFIIISLFTGIVFYMNIKRNDINVDYENNIAENAYEIPIYNSIDDVFEFTYKKVLNPNTQEYTYTLIYIDKNSGKECKITNRYGAYTYGNNKVYVCCTDNNTTHTIYEIDLTNNMEEKEIYSFDKRYSIVDHLEFYNNKIYYCLTYGSSGWLSSLNLKDNTIELISELKNVEFRIKGDNIFFIDEREALITMNLQNNEKEIIDFDCNIENISEDKLVFGKSVSITDDQMGVFYYEYDLNSKKEKEIIENYYGGIMGEDRIVRFNSKYFTFNKELQLIEIEDNGKEKVLTEEKDFHALTILPNNEILLERNEPEDEEGYGENIKSYIYNMEKNTLTPTEDNRIYEYSKIILDK